MLKTAGTCDVCTNPSDDVARVELTAGKDFRVELWSANELCRHCASEAQRLLVEWAESNGAANNLGL